MNKINGYAWIGCLIAIIFASCKHNEENRTGNVLPPAKVNLTFTPTFGNAPFNWGSVYTTSSGYNIRIENLLSYFSQIRLQSSNGQTAMLKDFALLDFSQPMPTYTAEIPEGLYDSLYISLGIPATFNVGVDPSIYPSSSPLSVAGSQGMFWNWNSGYIFFKYDGKADVSGTSTTNLTDPFAFHVGDDVNYRVAKIGIPAIDAKKGSVNTLNLTVDLEHVLVTSTDTINLQTDFLTHTSDNPQLAKRVSTNFAGAFRVE
jgi:hypothetical protein